MTTMIGIVLAYAVASAVPTMEAANALLPTYVTTCMYFGGLFLLFDKIPTGKRLLALCLDENTTRSGRSVIDDTCLALQAGNGFRGPLSSGTPGLP